MVAKDALADLGRNWLRSGLTLFGILWGIASFVVLSGLGRGFQSSQQSRFQAFGVDMVVVWPGQTGAQAGGRRAGEPIRLTEADTAALASAARLVRRVSPEVISWGVNYQHGPRSFSGEVHGVMPEYGAIRNMVLRRGRFITQADVDEARRVVVIGGEIGSSLFSERTPLGQRVRIRGAEFTVVGEVEMKNQSSAYSGRDNKKGFIPFTTARALLSRRWLNNLVFQPISADKHEEAIQEVRSILARRHGFDKDDRDALHVWDTVESFRNITNLFLAIKVLLAVVGATTLSVGGVGVVNIMLVAVRQRVNEIGVRRAVGARRRDIFVQFFVESLIISLAGGAAGVLTGVGLCRFIAGLSLPEGFSPPEVTGGILMGAAAVLAGVAVLAGIIPALRAASTMPLAALRESAATVA
ncbi:MAG TPA: ABC transporter permease [Candidatus Polarisedimenticolia bacterium]|nr:ABC transporter permease [Candidatus Polarisedimenticolia bacterium]